MIIVSLSEKLENEKRVSITPEIAKKYVQLGFEVRLSKNYGSHLGYSEKDFNDSGVKFEEDENKLLNDANIILQMGLLEENKLDILKSNQIYIGVLNPYENQDKLSELVKKKITMDFQQLKIMIIKYQKEEDELKKTKKSSIDAINSNN